MSARVIILNGVSSAGKSSLAKAIQDQADTTFLHVEMDAFISFLPNGHEFKPEWFRLDKVDGGSGELPRISNGPRGEALLSVMRQFVIEAAQKGLDLVVDEVCYAAEMDVYRRGLNGCDAHIWKVTAPLDVIEAREKARGDRLIGLARGQSTDLHQGIAYDGEIDTSTASPCELAATILAQL
ncbi:chloramphenicol phosphotransferase CPT family protein [Erythrobacter rubeus]|uniref:Chloramphenicol phosphotransferase n=1 Tax=Erythrobacter rubeus TaxID=2760803 RepID=A0ABR8KQ95_9SPHN|nr:chloramphenicol phosphotransferase [Erythrobacter rubeus]MBD2842069.1 chloramphenicol phosphotransferase [Erythrobacter rubeus]